MLTVPPSEGYNRKNPRKGTPGAQVAVGWHECLQCKKNKGSDEKTLVIKCGFLEGRIVEIKSIPI